MAGQITYALTNHELDVATIFSSLQFFNVSPTASFAQPTSHAPRAQIIRTPLIYLPLVLASAPDALVALRRISAFLLAEELAVPYVVDAESKFALNVDADFTWEAGRKEPGAGASKAAKAKAAAEAKANEKRLSGKGKKEPVLPTVASEKASGKEKELAEETEEKPFELKDVKLKIPKGSFVAIVGRVGSGKVRGLSLPCVRVC